MLLPQKPPYGDVSQAFRHLAKQDSYAPYEERNQDEWVVVFFHETLTCRLFPTLEAVGKYYNWQVYATNTFLEPAHLSMRFTGQELVQIFNELREPTLERSHINPDHNVRIGPYDPALPDEAANVPIEVAKKVWGQLQIVGDRVTGIGQNMASTRDEDPNRYQVKIAELKEAIENDALAHLPRQARIVAQGLADAEKTSYSEEELQSFARQLVITGKLKTKQNSARIVKYYAPNLNELGLLIYPRRKRRSDCKRAD